MRMSTEAGLASRLAPLLRGAFAVTVALTAGVVVGTTGIPGALALLYALAVLVALALEQDVIVAVLTVAAAISFDWFPYPGIPIYHPDFAFVVAAALLAAHLVLKHGMARWTAPSGFGLWAAILLIGLYPMLRSASLVEGMKYYLSNLGNSALLYFIGANIAKEVGAVRGLCNGLTALASLIALHSVIEALTGVFLFSTPGLDQYLVTYGSFTLPDFQGTRAGSFLLNPDWNGVFLATMTPVCIGLLLSASTGLGKLLHLTQVGLLLLGLLFTYSTASWLSLGVGMLVLIALIGSVRTRAYILGLAGAVLAAVTIAFPFAVGSLLQHATASRSLSLRIGLWATALNIIRHNLLTGIGFGLYTYTARAEPYRVPLQPRPYPQPHQSYLEIAAMGGTPLLLLFLAVLGVACYKTLRTTLTSSGRMRSLLAGGAAAIAVFSFNALAINAWTLAPLATLAWLLLGTLSHVEANDGQELADAGRAAPEEEPSVRERVRSSNDEMRSRREEREGSDNARAVR